VYSKRGKAGTFLSSRKRMRGIMWMRNIGVCSGVVRCSRNQQ
jgi:hypothetical protein